MKDTLHTLVQNWMSGAISVNKILTLGQYPMALQWHIHDFPEKGSPTLKVGVPTYYLVKNFPKTA